MESKLKGVLRLETEPVAVLFADEKPAGASQFLPGKSSCVMFMLTSAAGGKTVAFDRTSYGCPGGGVGLGFGNVYANGFPGGMPGFCGFLSNGNEGNPAGKAIGAGMKAAGAPERFVDHFLHGERFKKSPELVEKFVEALPITDIPAKYVVMKPLSQVTEEEEPVSITYLVNPDQLSALVILANYDRPGLENVAVPYVAACQVVGLLSFKEAKSDNPRCLIGLTDISARRYLKKQGASEKLTFTIPFQRLQEMESNIAGSFLEGHTWSDVID
jgi:uncharacterized protein (DUF169 family)